MLIDEMISAGHARAILAITDKDKQTSVAMKVFDEKLSVRETEKLVKHLSLIHILINVSYFICSNFYMHCFFEINFENL